MNALQRLLLVALMLAVSIGRGQNIGRFFGINVGSQTNQTTRFVHVDSVAKVETIATNLTVVIAGHLWTNATLRVLNSTNASISSGTTAKRINLADLPEPYRSQFYDNRRDQRLRDEGESARQAKTKAVAQRADKIALARKQVIDAIAAERAERSKPIVTNDSIEVTEVRGAIGTSDVTITGQLTNKTRKELKSLIIVFALYDILVDQVGTASARIDTLAPGESWRFSATGDAKNADAYRVDKITCSDGRLD